MKGKQAKNSRTAKIWQRIIICINKGEAERTLESPQPIGEIQGASGGTMLMRVPAAKNPVTRITIRIITGNNALGGKVFSADMCLKRCLRIRKKTIPASIRVPSISKHSERIRAKVAGIVNGNWARMTTSRKTAMPQNRNR